MRVNPEDARLEGLTFLDKTGIEQLMLERFEQSFKHRDASIRALGNPRKDLASELRLCNEDLKVCDCPTMEIPFEDPLDGAYARFPVKHFEYELR
jgi:hypothetical protein